MNTLRTKLGAVAVGLGSMGLMAACAPSTPAEPPETTVPDGSPTTDTSTFTLSCDLDIYQAGSLLFSTSNTYASVVSITAPNGVAAGSNAAYSVDVTGLLNGPLDQTGGTANVELSLGGGAPFASPLVPLGFAAGGSPGDPIVIPTINGDAGPINAATTLAVTSVQFDAEGVNAGDGAIGNCDIAPADQPSVSIGLL